MMINRPRRWIRFTSALVVLLMLAGLVPVAVSAMAVPPEGSGIAEELGPIVVGESITISLNDIFDEYEVSQIELLSYNPDVADGSLIDEAIVIYGYAAGQAMIRIESASHGQSPASIVDYRVHVLPIAGLDRTGDGVGIDDIVYYMAQNVSQAFGLERVKALLGLISSVSEQANSAPVSSWQQYSVELAVGQQVELELADFFYDADGDPLFYELVGGDPGPSVQSQLSSGILTLTGTSPSQGRVYLTVQATDEVEGTYPPLQTIAVRVIGDDMPNEFGITPSAAARDRWELHGGFDGGLYVYTYIYLQKSLENDEMYANPYDYHDGIFQGPAGLIADYAITDSDDYLAAYPVKVYDGSLSSPLEEGQRFTGDALYLEMINLESIPDQLPPLTVTAYDSADQELGSYTLHFNLFINAGGFDYYIPANQGGQYSGILNVGEHLEGQLEDDLGFILGELTDEMFIGYRMTPYSEVYEPIVPQVDAAVTRDGIAAGIYAEDPIFHIVSESRGMAEYELAVLTDSGTAFYYVVSLYFVDGVLDLENNETRPINLSAYVPQSHAPVSFTEVELLRDNGIIVDYALDGDALTLTADTVNYDYAYPEVIQLDYEHAGGEDWIVLAVHVSENQAPYVKYDSYITYNYQVGYYETPALTVTQGVYQIYDLSQLFIDDEHDLITYTFAPDMPGDENGPHIQGEIRGHELWIYALSACEPVVYVQAVDSHGASSSYNIRIPILTVASANSFSYTINSAAPTVTLELSDYLGTSILSEPIAYSYRIQNESGEPIGNDPLHVQLNVSEATVELGTGGNGTYYLVLVASDDENGIRREAVVQVVVSQ